MWSEEINSTFAHTFTYHVLIQLMVHVVEYIVL